jgi:peptidoglycan/xylan/chitin deacetylase (PgdA/CDA1 family)
MRGNHQRRLVSAHELAALTGRLMPRGALSRMVGQALTGLGVSLCMHRISPSPRATDWQRDLGLSMPAGELDALIELLLAGRPGHPSGWLSVTFDDGYRDAARYIAVAARKFPDVEFIFFVCPDKTERNVGFRWDLIEERIKAGTPEAEATGLMMAPTPSYAAELARQELEALRERPEYALATVDELRELKTLPNVKLGNHTNLHLSAQLFPDEIVKADFERSTATFERLFGPVREFAFPFGTPGFHFDQRHVAWLRTLGTFSIWSTEARPYLLSERAPGAVLPRFPVDGSQDAKAIAGWIAAKALQFRLQGTRHRFPY